MGPRESRRRITRTPTCIVGRVSPGQSFPAICLSKYRRPGKERSGDRVICHSPGVNRLISTRRRLCMRQDAAHLGVQMKIGHARDFAIDFASDAWSKLLYSSKAVDIVNKWYQYVLHTKAFVLHILHIFISGFNVLESNAQYWYRSSVISSLDATLSSHTPYFSQSSISIGGSSCWAASS